MERARRDKSQYRILAPSGEVFLIEITNDYDVVTLEHEWVARMARTAELGVLSYSTTIKRPTKEEAIGAAVLWALDRDRKETG